MLACLPGEVAACAASNRMDVANLAIVFAPNIARPEIASPSELAEVPVVAAAIAAAIRTQAAHSPPANGRGCVVQTAAQLPLTIAPQAPARAPSVALYVAPATAESSSASLDDGPEDGDIFHTSYEKGDRDARESKGEGGYGGADRWWYSLEGKQLGPVSARELASMLQLGALCDASFVYEDGADDWVEMASVRALLSRGHSELGATR